jgi:predicted PhzF superfamily epimerase YddE/YHI9
MHNKTTSDLIRFWYINAFSSRLLGGNPTIVVQSDDWLSREKKQQLATSFNLSETVFIEGIDRKNLSWFTPSCEVELCGHGTLSAAFVTLKPKQSIAFNTRSGDLLAYKDDNNKVHLTFSRIPVQISKPPPSLSKIINSPIVGFGQTKQNDGYWVAEVAPCQLTDCKVEVEQLKQLTTCSLILTCKQPGQSKQSIFLRYFAPNHGVNEDIVTGSANIVLSDYYQQTYQWQSFHAVQQSWRGGALKASISNDQNIILEGTCKLIAEGTLSPDLYA